MFIVLKGVLLFFSIIVFMPLVFFILIGGFGRSFALTVHPTSWLARTKVKWIRAFTNKFLAWSHWGIKVLFGAFGFSFEDKAVSEVAAVSKASIRKVVKEQERASRSGKAKPQRSKDRLVADRAH